MRKYLGLLISIIMITTVLVGCYSVRYFELVSVGYVESEVFNQGALNSEKLSINDGEHLPIYKIDSLSELEQFKVDSSDDFQSFELSKDFDEEFFDIYSLFVVYVATNSSSYRYKIDETVIEDGTYNVYVKLQYHPENVTDDMAGWFIFINEQKSKIKDCTSFDAQMVD